MLVVDVSEDKRVIKKLTKRLGKDGFIVEQIGTFDCRDRLFPVKKGYCIDAEEFEILNQVGVDYNKDFCKDCDKRKYTRFADFTNDTKSFFYERKTVVDFISSRQRRLYDQLNRIDTFVENRKGLILEGMSEFVPIYDSFWQNIDKGRLEKLSPLAQVVELGGRKEWTMSFIRELKMRDMEFVQTWNLDETIDFLIQCDEGYDKEPKLRILPKRYPDIPLEQNILVLFDGVGKQRSENILKEYGDLAKLIKELPNIKGDNRILNQLKEVFIIGKGKIKK